MPRLRRRRYRTISKDEREVILELADQYPGMTLTGLVDEVERLGYKVDPGDLFAFLCDHDRKPPFPGYRRRGMWDVGWPTWSHSTPAGDIEWPAGEPYEHRFPLWGWAAKQPLWFRLLMILPCLLYVGQFVARIIMRR